MGLVTLTLYWHRPFSGSRLDRQTHHFHCRFVRSKHLALLGGRPWVYAPSIYAATAS